MLKGRCINAADTTTLQNEQEYFLFPAGQNHYYVSMFNNTNAHFGCYQAERFQVVEEEEWPQEPPVEFPQLKQCSFYKAKLIWRQRGHRNKELKAYFVKPGKTHCYFWHDQERTEFCGCFPVHWFTNFEPITEQEVHVEAEEQQIELLERVDGQLAFF